MESASRIARARLAALIRHRGQDDPATVQARAIYADQFTRERLQRLLACPELAPEMRLRLQDLVGSSEGSAAA